ncbi:MAG: RNA polymerase sigma factor [Acidobacteria bacterium]|nr:MAG: RNA polymerase sigma factor [Acidobacteriota bacterium]REK09248.1 MAG: RNA polymerase sigma factor [Acidobacteriota bacterium]
MEIEDAIPPVQDHREPRAPQRDRRASWGRRGLRGGGSTLEDSGEARVTSFVDTDEDPARSQRRASRPAELALHDDELVRRVLAGDLAAYDALMHRYEQLVSRVAFGFGNDRDDALDITQEVFLKVYDNLGSYRQGTNFRAWLLRIVTNQGISWLRKQRRHRSAHDPLEDEAPPPAYVDSSLAAEGALLQRERADRLLASLQQIQPRYRAALSMRYFQELSIREISEELVCTEAVTKSLLFRGVRKLRDLMGAHYQQQYE